MKPITLVFCLLSLALFFSSGFVNRVEMAQPQWNNLLARIQSGDLVFRLGHGFISESLKKFSLKDSRYSHAGIISMENGKPIVYHLLGGESSATVLQKETLEKFCSPGEAVSFAVYRAPLHQAQKKSVDSLNQFYFHARLRYDSRFDLATDSVMYCTEYVYKVLIQAMGKNNILIPSSVLSGQAYMACDDIYLNATMKKIFSFDYE